MTLTQISEFASLVTAFATLVLAFLIYRWTRLLEKNSQAQQMNHDFQEFNKLVISNDELAEIERANHPFGDLSVPDVKKMYFYFLWLNIADNTLRTRDNALIDPELADSRMSNQALVTFSDRNFIEAHVFPRGYENQKICKELRKRWKALELKT